MSSGKSVSSDNIILAFGNFAPTDDIFIIGTGLTAADAILSLYHKNHAGKIDAFSTRGLLPAVHKL